MFRPFFQPSSNTSKVTRITLNCKQSSHQLEADTTAKIQRPSPLFIICMLITISQRHSARDVKRPSLVLFVLGDVVKWNSSKAKRKMIGDIIEAVSLSGFFPSFFLYLFGTANETRPPAGALMSVLTVLD